MRLVYRSSILVPYKVSLALGTKELDPKIC